MNTCWRCQSIRISEGVLDFDCDKGHEVTDGEHDCVDYEGEAGTDREVLDE